MIDKKSILHKFSKFLAKNIDTPTRIKKFLATPNKANLFKSTTQKEILEKKIKDFRKLYSPSKNAKLYKEHKTIKFAQFYLELGSSLDIDKKILKTQNRLLLLLVKYLHGWDDLIDEKNILIPRAKELVIPDLEEEKTRAALHEEITNKLSTTELQQLKESVVTNKEEELHLINQLQISMK